MKDKFEENYDGPSSYQNFYDMAQYTFKWILNYFDKNLWPIQDKYADFKVIEDNENPYHWYKIILKSTHEIDIFNLFEFRAKLDSHIQYLNKIPFNFEFSTDYHDNLPYKETIEIDIWFLDFRESYDLFLNSRSDEENNDVC